MWKSISGYKVLLKGVPVIFKISTQKMVALSVCEAEHSAGVLCAQDIVYIRNVLESIGLKVKLSMLLEMHNKGTVNLAHNWTVQLIHKYMPDLEATTKGHLKGQHQEIWSMKQKAHALGQIANLKKAPGV